jgi:cell division protein FtsQ
VNPGARLSTHDLAQRRRQLRRRRGWRSLGVFWRLGFVGAVAGGLTWGLSSPRWLLTNPKQIEVEGNHIVSTQTIRRLLPIRYPQSLLALQPEKLEAELTRKAPFSIVRVQRQLFPAGLKVQVVERVPVAIAEVSLSPGASLLGDGEAKDDAKGNAKGDAKGNAKGDAKGDAKGLKVAVTQQVLLDKFGMFIPLDRYQAPGLSLPLPGLKVMGMREDYRPLWPDFYQAIRQSPVSIERIDWRDPSNVILHTELGQVHIGAYSPQLPQQLQVLDQMRALRNHEQAKRILYIDLRMPSQPRLQMDRASRGASDTANGK